MDSLKVPEAAVISPPAFAAAENSKETLIIIILAKAQKIYIRIGDSARKIDILNALNENKQLNLNAPQIAELLELDSIGIPLIKLKSLLNASQPIRASQMSGIPVTAAGNELTDWLKATVDVWGTDSLENRLVIKGNANLRYPLFKDVKKALRANNIFKLRIVTASE